MHFPKSTPDLNDFGHPRSSTKQRRVSRNSKQVKEFQLRVENPFRGLQQQNMLPEGIYSQVQHMQYITSSSIKNIEVPQYRRPSGLQKNLQIMQELARRQQQKYSGMLKEGLKKQGKKEVQFSNQQQFLAIQDDRVSLELNCFYDHDYEYLQRIEDDFSIFEKQDHCSIQGEQLIMFYSNHEIQPSAMDQQFNQYIG